jgi:ATP-binding cassette, subfamily B (MDR/TAP), member 7
LYFYLFIFTVSRLTQLYSIISLNFLLFLTIVPPSRLFQRKTTTKKTFVFVSVILFSFPFSLALFFIGSVYREVKQGLIDMEAMFQLMDTKPTITNKPNAIRYDPTTMGTSIQLDDVHFAYPTTTTTTAAASSTLLAEGGGKSTKDNDATVTNSTTARPILRGTTLSIQQGRTVAIVGSSGCGKSTILRLLFRFYEPTSGTVRLGNHPIDDYDIDSVRRAIAIIPQDTILFNDTIRYNIRYGNLSSSDDDVIDAARQAKIHDTIQSFPDGYDTVVGERGLKLSGGEKQRVAIARAILKRSPIILCDEPTSSLDSETEIDIMNNLKSIMIRSSSSSSTNGSNNNNISSSTTSGSSSISTERTSIIIAHRLSTVQDCDTIIVMDQGRVVEAGTHDELVQLGGRYTELLKMQEHLEE